MIHKLSDAIAHNTTYVIESIVAWCLVATGHVVGGTVDTPLVTQLLPYVQLCVYCLAGVTSICTIYKIRKDLKK